MKDVHDLPGVRTGPGFPGGCPPSEWRIVHQGAESNGPQTALLLASGKVGWDDGQLRSVRPETEPEHPSRSDGVQTGDNVGETLVVEQWQLEISRAAVREAGLNPWNTNPIWLFRIQES